MSALWQRDEFTQTTLADATGTDKATITRILDRMVRDGLVERRADAADRRAFRIHLTDTGKELHQQLLPVVQEIVQRAFKDVDQAQHTALRATLQRVFDNLRDVDRPDSADGE